MVLARPWAVARRDRAMGGGGDRNICTYVEVQLNQPWMMAWAVEKNDKKPYSYVVSVLGHGMALVRLDKTLETLSCFLSMLPDKTPNPLKKCSGSGIPRIDLLPLLVGDEVMSIE